MVSRDREKDSTPDHPGRATAGGVATGVGLHPTLANLLSLQRSAGNRAVTHMLRATGSHDLAPPTQASQTATRLRRPTLQRTPDDAIEVTVVDDRVDPSRSPWWLWPLSPGGALLYDMPRFTGPLAAATRTGEVYMTSVRTMVANVLGKIGERKMSRLNIVDHGNETGMQFGDDWINSDTLAGHESELRKLRGRFSAGGFVHVQHCNVGQDRDLIVALARIFDVSVYAGTGAHNPVVRVNYGDYVRGDPDGTYATDVDRP